MPLDPRTKILGVTAINLCIITVVKTPVTLFSLVLAIFLITASKQWKLLMTFSTLAVSFQSSYLIGSHTNSLLSGFLLVLGEYGTRLSIVVAVSAWLILSTQPAALFAALRRLHLPSSFIIPITVMFRFFPAVIVEARAIWDAMQIRGLFPTWWTAVKHPILLMEYLIVPLLGSTLQIADDIAVSAMTRGLGSPLTPTSVVKLGFSWRDGVVVGAIVGLIGVFIAALLGVV
ncbi:energy-coupling factor transporter transmembrane component T [Arcanobacterium ihumii]|uniref:energy-coupling factor transporter transmembrane component T n=1 Tax=Arcanobacterium ihumii TaxID=2138162 RepID=UPI00135AA253|nr:energy-coupling factor transporter transmembrane component T [Arcanobacterium ihumii]